MAAADPKFETEDTILRGRVRVLQPKVGARFTSDPILLADFVVRTCAIAAKDVCDLGAGSGVLGLVLATLDSRLHVLGVELQANLVALAERSARLNGLSERVQFRCEDIRKLRRTSKRGCDLVVANPPYYEDGGGTPAGSKARLLARQGAGGTIEIFIAAAARVSSPRGSLAMVFPATRLHDLYAALEAAKFRVRRMRLVHPRSAKPATRVLLLAQRTGPRTQLLVDPPLVLHEGNGWSDEAKRIFGEASR